MKIDTIDSINEFDTWLIVSATNQILEYREMLAAEKALKVAHPDFRHRVKATERKSLRRGGLISP